MLLSDIFAGGSSPDPSRVDRIDYSNDTATASPKGPLSVNRNMFAGTSAQANAITNLTLFPAPTVRENVAPQELTLVTLVVVLLLQYQQ